MGFVKKSFSMIVETAQASSRKARQILLRDNQHCQSLLLPLDMGKELTYGERRREGSTECTSPDHASPGPLPLKSYRIA